MYLLLGSIKGLLQLSNLMTVHEKRDAVLLALLYDSGARAQELIDHKVLDMIVSGTVIISPTGKGGNCLDSSVMKTTGELLKQYIDKAGFVLPVQNRRPLFTNCGYKLFTRACVI